MRSRLLMPALFSLLTALIIFAFPMITSAQGKIAFTSDRTGNDEIYVMNADGTNPVNVSNDPAPDRWPSLSPNGSKIAFASERNGRFDIYIMNVDGTGQTNLTGSIGLFNIKPAFSPDGNKIVFLSDGSDGNTKIVMINADGTNPIDQTLNFTLSERDPSFSPDGSKIVFAARFDQELAHDIYVVDLNQLNPVRLNTDVDSDVEPAFSPDGTKIVFSSARDGNEEIYVMNADGTNPIRLTQNAGVDTAPIFSPDGTKIAYSSDRPTGWNIYIMNADGTDQAPLTNTPGFLNQSPSWADSINAPPTLSNVTVTPASIIEGGTITVAGGLFNGDPTDSFSLAVNWGDDSPEQVFNYNPGTTSFSETHQYLDNLSDIAHPVNLTLSTANGSDSELVFAAVYNVSPIVSIAAPPPVIIGSPFTLSGYVTDPGILDTQTFTINWGDGSPETVLNVAAGTTDFSANHTYASLGAYTVTVSATDDDGGSATPVNVLVGVVPLPTSGKIAFTSNFAGNNNIYLMNSNGTGPVALTTNPASDSYPDLSQDGSKIVFVSDRDGNPEIYVMNAAGAFQTRLTNTAAVESEPVFNHDGTKIVFSSNRDGNHEIYIMNADGTGQQRLTTNSVDDGQAEFSPDGTKIIFSRLAANQTDAHIITMDLTGANQLPLTSGSFVLNGYPSYSPDGQKIVFSRANLTHTNAEIYTMDANGANAVRLTTAGGDDLESAFSPDGTKIVFRSARDGNSEIYLMDAAGTNQQRITFDGPGFSNFAPSWSEVSLISVDVPNDLAAPQGATLTVPIIVSDTTGKGVVSYDFTLIFDPAVLQLQTPTFDKAGTLSSGFEVNAGSSSPGLVTVSAFGTAPLSGAGTLLNLKFNVIGTPPTSSLLTLHPFMFNEGIPFSELSSGQVFVQGTISGTVLYGTSATTIGVPGVLLSASGNPNTSSSTAADGTYLLGGFGPGPYTVTPSKSGDINGITALDASLISQFLVGSAVLSSIQQAAGEVSGNGTLTSFDASLIAQYVVGNPNTGFTGTWRFSPGSRSYATVGNMTAEDYLAILMGEVSGNWTSSFAPVLALKGGKEDHAEETIRPWSEVKLSLPAMQARPDDLVSIPVDLRFMSTGTLIEAYQFELLYDPSVISPEANPVDMAGTLSNRFAAVANSSEAGRLRLAVYGSDLIGTDGTLIYLKFRVVGRSGASTALVFKNLLFNEGDPVADSTKGRITVRRR